MRPVHFGRVRDFFRDLGQPRYPEAGLLLTRVPPPPSGVSLEVGAAPDEMVVGRRAVRVAAVVSSEFARYGSLQAEVFFDQSGLQLSGPAERSLPAVEPNSAHRATWALNALEAGIYLLTIEVHGVDEQGHPVARHSLRDGPRRCPLAVSACTRGSDRRFRDQVLSDRRRVVRGIGVSLGKKHASNARRVDAAAAAMLIGQARQEYLALPDGRKRCEAGSVLAQR